MRDPRMRIQRNRTSTKAIQSWNSDGNTRWITLAAVELLAFEFFLCGTLRSLALHLNFRDYQLQGKALATWLRLEVDANQVGKLQGEPASWDAAPSAGIPCLSESY